MKKRMFVYFFIFTISVFHLLIPNVVFGQSFAEQVFTDNAELLQQESVRFSLRNALDFFKQDNIRETLLPIDIQIFLKSPLILAGFEEFDDEFINLLSTHDDFRKLFGSELFYNVLISEEEIDELVKLIEQTPAKLEIDDGNYQLSETGTDLQPFVVVVKDRNDVPLSGVEVAFRVTEGRGGRLSPPTAQTHSGRASTTLTFGSAPGIYQVEATVVDFPSLTQTFTAAATGVSGEQDEDPKPTTIVATSGQSDIAPEEVTISEIMFVSNKRALPQWIELNNSSNTDVDLEGWTLEIHGIFGLPVAGKVKIEDTAGGTLEIITTLNFQNQHRQYVQFIFPKRFIKPQETLLIASSFSRKFKSSLPEKRVHVLEIHKLLGEAFYLKLSNKTGELVDEVGNFNILTNRTDWSLPNSVTEDRYRASMIRRHDFGVPRPGTEQRAWISAIKTDLVNSSTTYYGDDSDIGAPGIKNGGAVPVQLSSFRAERIDAGVAITWSTESELDNAGFTIRRSKTQNDVFRSIHARLILGAGTTSEKNDYTFIDTTAEPGVIYYYQIEDISFGGVRQTLATTRLRGDFSAKGKSTTTWGSLKGQY